MIEAGEDASIFTESELDFINIIKDLVDIRLVKFDMGVLEGCNAYTFDQLYDSTTQEFVKTHGSYVMHQDSICVN